MWTAFKELIDYRDLFFIFAWREFKARYKQASLGIAWAVLQPLSLMALFVFIFSYIIPIRTEGLPRPLFFYAGLLPWLFFSSSLNLAIPCMTRHYNLITKIYFPRAIIPLSGVALSLVDFLIASVLFVFIILFYRIPLSWQMLWFLPLLVILLLFTAALSLIFSALNVYYRDVALASHFFIQLMFFGSPVFYSIEGAPEWIKPLMMANPLGFVINHIRGSLVEGQSMIGWQCGTMLILSVLIFGLSYQFFHRTERKFADVI